MRNMNIDDLLETKPVIEKSKMINVNDKKGNFFPPFFIKERDILKLC